MTIKIPVKSYTRKFLAFYLGENYKLRIDDAYGLHLFVLLQMSNEKSQFKNSLKRYKCKFEVEASDDRLAKAGYQGLTNLTIIYFNNFVEAVFKQEFHSAADIYLKMGKGTVQNAINDIMDKFALTAEDIDPMTLRRGYLRYRKLNGELEDLRKKSGEIKKKNNATA